jgi:hypothetical protein
LRAVWASFFFAKPPLLRWRGLPVDGSGAHKYQV